MLRLNSVRRALKLRAELKKYRSARESIWQALLERDRQLLELQEKYNQLLIASLTAQSPAPPKIL